MTAKPQEIERPQTRAVDRSHVLSGVGFDWVMAGLGGLFIGGLYIDGWAHNHLTRIETFFTPWHAMFYGSFALLALVFAWYVFAGIRAGGSWSQAIPRGYEWSAIGIALFALCGVGDMIWHIFFGIERSTEALLSPTHVGLATGMALVLTGPIRAAVARGDAARGNALWPAVLSLTWLYSGLTFMTQFAPAMVQWGVGPAPPPAMAEIRIDRSITAQLFDAALLSGVVVYLMREWGDRMPFGSVTVVVVLNSLLMETQQGGNEQLLGIFLSGLVSALLIWWLRPTPARIAQFRLVAFLVPFLYWTAHYATYAMHGMKMYYPVHIYAGLPVIAGLIGLLASYLAVTGPRQQPAPGPLPP